jgi:hypothetical protein
MLIMTLSYTLKTNDTSLIKTYVRASGFDAGLSLNIMFQTGLLDQWTQFLIQDSLIPAKQVSFSAIYLTAHVELTTHSFPLTTSRVP